jgi:shikimate 5-dehydrogenase
MKITGRTALLAILADPVARTCAPGLINAVLVSRGIDAVLVPFRVGPHELGRVVATAERGCAVHFGKPILEAQIDLMVEFMAS